MGNSSQNKKNHTHMWRCWGTTHNFHLAFIDEPEKQILKKLLKWANKKQIILIFTMLHFKKKRKTPADIIIKILMIWSTVPEIHSKQTEIGKFRSFFALYPPKTPKNRNSQKWKNLLEISSWCWDTDNFFWYFGPFFALLPPKYQMIQNIKILKKMKKMAGEVILFCAP